LTPVELLQRLIRFDTTNPPGNEAECVEFVRSLYFLGQISERRGDRARARAYYQRFVNYWGDGDIDRERVAEARKKIRGPA